MVDRYLETIVCVNLKTGLKGDKSRFQEISREAFGMGKR